MKKKWLIFGGNGWIGKQFTEILEKQSRPYCVPDVRADDYFAVEEYLKQHGPQTERVISFIGRTHGEQYTTIDYLEQPGKIKENVRDNLYGPLVLALLCLRHRLHLTYLGTGCIFTGDESNPFPESAEPNFFGSAYSVVKGFTDRLMGQHFKNTVLNVRIRMPISGNLEAPRNFIYKITHYAKVCSTTNSMTVLPELLPLLVDMIDRKVTGTVNLVNPGAINHNEILEMYRELVDPEFKWENFSIAEQDEVLAAKRSNCVLDSTRLQDMYPSVSPIHEAVRQLFLKK